MSSAWAHGTERGGRVRRLVTTEPRPVRTSAAGREVSCLWVSYHLDLLGRDAKGEIGTMQAPRGWTWVEVEVEAE